MTTGSGRSVGAIWRGEPGAPPPPRAENRLHAIFDGLEAVGMRVEPIAFTEEAVDEIRRQVLNLDAVLVWVDPIVRGRDRSVLDALLREAAAAGIFVSSHPDVILKMGTKDVLVRTRDMAWGSETYFIKTLDELHARLPGLVATGPWVLKQYRGSGGDGIWKVERGGIAGEVRVLHALRGSSMEDLPVDDFARRCEPYFAGGAGMIAQPYQPRLGEGMTRCYLSGDRVVGFGHQLVTALLPPPAGSSTSPPPPPRYYFGPDKPEFQRLKSLVEGGWVAEMQRICEVPAESLPAIWDADFLLGPKDAAGEDSYVLCEINISGVFPIPDESIAPLAAAVVARLRR